MENEVVFSCSQSPHNVRISAWDLSTGTIQRTYSYAVEGGGALICFLGRQYLLCALQKAPFICVWNTKKEQVHMKISTVGLVGALACSPEGTYCAAAISEKIHIWEVSTGHLLAVFSQHYQPVTVLRFSDDGIHLISGAGDARVIVWRLSSVLSEAFLSGGHSLPHGPTFNPGSQSSALQTIKHVWSHHSLPITDIYCGRGGHRARVVTASLDQTCKIYELCSGRLLCSFLFDYGVTSVTMDLAEYRLFVGGSNGKITQVNLFLGASRRSEDVPISEKEAGIGGGGGGSRKDMYFTGHTKPVTGVAVSCWGHQLVSCSQDGSTRIWDIVSHQTVRTISTKGPVSSMLMVAMTGSLLDARQPNSPFSPLNHFHKQLYKPAKDGSPSPVPMILPSKDPLADLKSSVVHSEFSHILATKKSAELEVLELKEKVAELQEVHRQMYTFATGKPHTETTSEPPQ